MFNLENGMRYWVFSEPTEMRKNFHMLSCLVEHSQHGADEALSTNELI